MQALSIINFGIIAVSLDVGIVNVYLHIRALRKCFGQEGHRPPSPPRLKSESARAPMASLPFKGHITGQTTVKTAE